MERYGETGQENRGQRAGVRSRVLERRHDALHAQEARAKPEYKQRSGRAEAERGHQSRCERGSRVDAEAAQDAEDAWVKTIIDSALQRAKFAEECTPGYYNNEGQPSALAARNGSYGKGPIAFVKLLEGWRAAGVLEGLETRPL